MVNTSIVHALMDVIAERKTNPPEKPSYVASLLRGGARAIGAKIEEEAAETVSAAHEVGPQARAHLIHEVADLIFHTLVLLGYAGILWSEIETELARRFGVSGIEEKKGRPSAPDRASGPQ